MNKKGLSLLEILISVLILALVMTGLANVFVAGKRHILHSRSRMTVSELGKYFLDPLQMQVRQNDWTTTTNCLGTGNCPPQTWTESTTNIVYTANTNWTIVPGTTLRKITTTINWSETSP